MHEDYRFYPEDEEAGLVPEPWPQVEVEKKHPGSVPMMCQWRVLQHNPVTGEVLYDETSKNLVVNTGRDDVLRLLFGLSGSSLVALGAGASSTAAAVTDVRLVYEHIGNATRKTLTNTSDATITASDIVTETYTEGSCTFYMKITVRAKYLTTDGNNGHPFQEYGLFTTTTLPATPTTSQPTMFNRYVAASPITKDSSTEIVVDVTIRV